MTDDPIGTALRDHLDEVLSGLQPGPSLLGSVRAERDRRLRRRTALTAAGSVLTAATAVVVVLVGTTFGAGDRINSPVVAIAPSASPSSAPPTYPPAQPSERWFTRPYAMPRPSGEIARFPMHAEKGDPANSQRTLLVWYNADKDTYCAMDTVQTEQHPEGADASGGGGCSAIPPANPRHTNVVLSSGNCDPDAGGYVFGVMGADATTVKVRGVGGPDPDVTVRRLDGAPTAFFVVIDPAAPILRFRYLDAGGHVVRTQTYRQPSAEVPVRCVTQMTPRRAGTPR